MRALRARRRSALRCRTGTGTGVNCRLTGTSQVGAWVLPALGLAEAMRHTTVGAAPAVAQRLALACQTATSVQYLQIPPRSLPLVCSAPGRPHPAQRAPGRVGCCDAAHQQGTQDGRAQGH